MMKMLCLIRHAKSSWKFPKLQDFDRPLNKRGRSDAPFMGALLKKKKIVPDQIISSPAIRAITTARIIAEELDYPNNKIIEMRDLYGATTDDLLKVAQGVEQKVKSLFLVGHNFDITHFAVKLSDKVIDNIPTCGIFSIGFDIVSWSEIDYGKGIFRFFEYPKKYL